jgi:YHS domain-containing protein
MHNQNHDEHHHHPDVFSEAIAAERQATCPVTGDTVDMQEAEVAGHVREYNGKKYYFCCATCVQQFDKNPEKYASSE